MKKLITVTLLAPLCWYLEAAEYRLVDLGTLGGTESFAGSINNSRMIVGMGRLPGDNDSREFISWRGRMLTESLLNSGQLRVGGWSALNNRGQLASGIVVGSIYYPALWDCKSGKVTVLGGLGGMTGYGFTGAALGINQSGDVVGFSYLDNFNRHAFVWSRGVMTDLGSFGGYSVAEAINNRRTIVGYSSDKVAGRAVAFVHQRGKMIAVDPFGGGESYARDVNDGDEVVGSGLTANQTQFRGFVWKRGRIADLGTLPGGHTCDPKAINNQGMVVGVADRPASIETHWDYGSGTMHTNIVYEWQGFLNDQAGMRPLNDLVDAPNWNLSWATDINEAGDIVGYGVVAGKFRAFLLTKSRGGAAK